MDKVDAQPVFSAATTTAAPQASGRTIPESSLPKLREQAAKLREAEAKFRAGREATEATDGAIKPGDIVKWKADMTNRRYPRPDGAAIVTRILPEPFVDPKRKDTGSPYFGEQLTIVLGIFDGDGDFIELHNDGARFEVVQDLSAVKAKHFSVVCDGCGAREFEGVRYRCKECDDYDLCGDCKDRNHEDAKHRCSHAMTIIAAPSVERMRDAYAQLTSEVAFQPGDIVQWKFGMKNKRRPRDDEMGIVVEILPHQIYDEAKNTPPAYFREPLDFKLGMIDSDGDFTVYHADSRRFMKVL